MKKIFSLLLVILSLAAFTQERYSQVLPAPQTKPWMSWDSTASIPRGPVPSLRGGINRPGAVFFCTTDSSLYTWTGFQWIKSSTGGVSTPTDSTLDQIASKGNVTKENITTAGTSSYETYGQVWTDNFARASLGSNYVNNAGSSTITFPSSLYMNIDGTSNSFTNYIARTDSTNENKGTIHLRGMVKELTADSYGKFIGWGNLNTHCCDHHVYGGIRLNTGSTQRLFIQAEAGAFLYVDSKTLTVSANDIINIWLKKIDWTYTVFYYNETTGERHSFSYTGNPAGSILPFTPNGFSRPVLGDLGGSFDVYQFERVSDESKYARSLWIGVSLFLGGNITDVSQRLPYLVAKGNHADVIISAGGGSVAAYSLATYTSDLSRYTNVQYVYLSGLGNDTLFSVYNNQGKAAYTALRNYFVAAGKTVIHVIETPRDGIDLTAIAAWVNATFPGDNIANLFDRYRVGTAFPSPWDAGDGTHWSEAFNREGARFIDSLFRQFTQPQYTGNIKGYQGDFQFITGNGIQEHDYELTAQTVTIKNDISLVKINPPSTVAAMTLKLPYDARPGYKFWIQFGGRLTTGVVVTALTISADASQTVIKNGFIDPLGGVTALPIGAGDWIVCTYDSSRTWYVNANKTFFFTDAYIQGHRFGRGNNPAEQSNTTGGYFVGNAITSATSFTGFGSQAGQLTTTGTRCSYFGAQAGLGNLTGNDVVALGDEALRQGSSGNDRTGVGAAALYNASGLGNTGVGKNVLFNTTTGASNVAIGPNTGWGITTGSNNLILGDNIQTLAAAQSGTVVIGSNALRRIWINSAGRLSLGGIGGLLNVDTANSSGWLRLPVGVTTTAPLLFQSGTSLSSPVAGAMEYTTDDVFFTIATGTARKRFLFADATGGLTSSRIPFATTNGRLADDANLNFSTGLGIGTTGSASYGITIGGSSWTAGVIGIVGATVTTPGGSTGTLVLSSGTLVEAASGTHPILANAYFTTPTITPGAATVTNAATLYVQGATTATVTGSNAAIRADAGPLRLGNGDVVLETAGNKLQIATGSNASIGTSSAMIAGTTTVSTTAVASSSKIFVTVATPGGTQGFLSIGTITNGTSFVINSSSATETSTVNWWIIN